MVRWSRWFAGARRRHKAAAFENVASALDAGLGAEAALATAAPGRAHDERLRARLEDGFVPALATVVELDRVDDACLTAAETAGTLPATLRQRAADARAASSFTSDLLGRLAYPVFLLVAAGCLVAFLAGLGIDLGPTPLVLGLVVPLLFAAVVVLAFQRARHAVEPGLLQRLPLLRQIASDLGELPYLRALHDLYAAGVRIDRAHEIAATTCPVASVRARLFVAGRDGPASGAPLVDALARTGAVHDETLSLLRPAQTSGDLEDALARAAERRAFRLRTNLTRAATLIGAVVYVIAVATVVSIVFTFYAQYLGRLGAR